MCELPSCYKSEWRISRKPHICCECRGTIFYKERYNYFSGIWDGRADSYKTCQDCYDIREELRSIYGFEELAFGEMYGENDCFDYNLFEKWIDICDKRGVIVYPESRKLLKELKRKCKRKSLQY